MCSVLFSYNEFLLQGCRIIVKRLIYSAIKGIHGRYMFKLRRVASYCDPTPLTRPIFHGPKMVMLTGFQCIRFPRHFFYFFFFFFVHAVIICTLVCFRKLSAKEE